MYWKKASIFTTNVASTEQALPHQWKLRRIHKVNLTSGLHGQEHSKKWNIYPSTTWEIHSNCPNNIIVINHTVQKWTYFEKKNQSTYNITRCLLELEQGNFSGVWAQKLVPFSRPNSRTALVPYTLDTCFYDVTTLKGIWKTREEIRMERAYFPSSTVQNMIYVQQLALNFQRNKILSICTEP